MNIFAKTFQTVSFFLAPSFCAYCQEWLFVRAIFCNRCSDMINPIVSIDLQLTKSKSMTVFAVSKYQEPLKSLILAKGRSDMLASKRLGHLVWEQTSLRYREVDYVIPVPLHWTRYAKRGFNQAEQIASVLSEKMEKPVFKKVKRIKRTQFQSAVKVNKRAENVQGAFYLDPKDAKKLTGKHIVLVDDLMTTGATLQAIAKVLVLYKPASICAVVASRVA